MIEIIKMNHSQNHFDEKENYLQIDLKIESLDSNNQKSNFYINIKILTKNLLIAYILARCFYHQLVDEQCSDIFTMRNSNKLFR